MVVKVALPPLRASVEEATWVLFLSVMVNVTVPVGVMPDALTVAVKVTDSPVTGVPLGEVRETVVVESVFTNCVSEEEVLALKLLSPLYSAVTA